MANNRVIETKRALLQQKQKLLDDLNYYERRLTQVRKNCTNANVLLDDDSSDSDTGLPVLDLGPSVPELKINLSKLKTCLQATQELTSLQVLQSEVNVMVEDPVYEGEPPVTEAGTWREVTAECRIDVLPFSIMFYTHKPNRLFGPLSYRGVRVAAVKSSHDVELRSSILPTVDTPADAVQVLRSYTHAYRSRRTSMSKLAERYGDALYMEPHSEGGFVLKCANLLEVTWRLENSRSPLAPFHHNMKFNFEYMDECFVKIITQAHKDLSNPNVSTEERTFLLSKIISTCLEAQGPTTELSESMESDQESVKKVEKRQTTLNHDIESPEERKRTEDTVMAPPKYLPKRTKPKGKENTVENTNKSVKRTISSNGMGSKKAKISESVSKSDKNIEKVVKNVISEVKTGTETTVTDLVTKKDVVNNNDKSKKVTKNDLVKTKGGKEKEIKENAVKTTDGDKKNFKSTANNPPVAKSKGKTDKAPAQDNINENLPKDNVDTRTKTKESVAGPTKKQKSGENLKKTKNDENVTSKPTKRTITDDKNTDSAKDIAKKSKKQTDINVLPQNEIAESKKVIPIPKMIKKTKDTNKIQENNKEITKNGSSEVKKLNSKENPKTSTKTKDNDNIKTKSKTTQEKNKQSNNINQSIQKSNINKNKISIKNDKKNIPTVKENTKVATIKTVTEKNVAINKKKDNILNVATPNRVGSKDLNYEKVQNKPKAIYNIKPALKVLNKHNMPSKNVARPASSGFSKADNTEKNDSGKASKIPQKTVTKTNSMKNPLRISPRKMSSMFKNPSQPLNQKMIKSSTNIPRLMANGMKTKT